MTAKYVDVLVAQTGYKSSKSDFGDRRGRDRKQIDYPLSCSLVYRELYRAWNGSSSGNYSVREPVAALLKMKGQQPVQLRDGEENVLGAIIFFSYIVAALVFTFIIIFDLAAPSRNGDNKGFTNREKALLQASLAVLSFGSLSYHMLRFLIASYVAWAENNGVPPPTSSSNLLNEMTMHRVWRWAKSSALFYDFARVICDDPGRYWWAQQALLYSMAWSTYMAVEGC